MHNDPLTFELVPGSRADARVFCLHGPITLGNLSELQTALMGSMPRVTVLDLTACPYMDSAGLGTLLNYYVEARRQEKFLRLVGVNHRVAALLQLTGAHKLLSSFSSVRAAERAAS